MLEANLIVLHCISLHDERISCVFMLKCVNQTLPSLTLYDTCKIDSFPCLLIKKVNKPPFGLTYWSSITSVFWMLLFVKDCWSLVVLATPPVGRLCFLWCSVSCLEFQRDYLLIMFTSLLIKILFKVSHSFISMLNGRGHI